GKYGCYFMGKYFSELRIKEKDEIRIQDVLRAAFLKKAEMSESPVLTDNYTFKIATPSNVKEIVSLYKTVFKTYPFPIHDPNYILSTMNNNVVYFGIWHYDKLIAISSCEIYANESNAEMTDFATLPDYRGRNLSFYLHNKMEGELKKRYIHNAYTIARAYSYGMNITFAKGRYTFAGTLTNNTNIAGNIESMNVWYKELKN
ncbi:MAG: putative beta-lysine N-acetyltransferase, partial [Clostridia bacterium]|nr:putative beta-lysine N-acetyltransferase [Clostridia bacterium]